MEIVLLILGVLVIFKEEIKALFRKPRTENEEEKKKKEEYKKQFDKIMNYSYEQAIEKRGDN
jgi:DNA integrity scanning protein DisA with diadenylate cyclase activity